MSIFSALYRLLIGPLELFFEIIFAITNQITWNPGIAIIVLSLIMNFLVLPLYKRADAMQEEERQTNARLKHWSDHIRKTFKGDERFMIMQTYYRQNNYKPTDALKGSVSLLLEIPFFIAAYNFLSTLDLLHGFAFGPITDLGAPDGLLVIGGLAINVLPILMTVINLVSSAIYTRDLPLKSKIQLYVMATLFLVLLYDSPAGLVFYWTLNNIFSLFKNIFYKLKNPRKVVNILFSVTGVGLLFYAFNGKIYEYQYVVIVSGLLLQFPIIIQILKNFIKRKPLQITISKKDNLTFSASGLFMTVLTGIMIPTTVIKASPEEFINLTVGTNPVVYIINSFLIAAGIFLIWLGIFYMLGTDSGKKKMEYTLVTVCAVSLVNFLFFGQGYGTMSSNLIFDSMPSFIGRAKNLLTCAAVFALTWVICKKKQDFCRFMLMIASVAALLMSGMDIGNIYKVSADKLATTVVADQELPTLSLSKKGQNVIVLMLDRGISSFVPYIMNERPEIKEQFSGFTYYPNTISFGGHTNIGAPALYGGYDYTPEEMNRQNHLYLVFKMNDALRVMPRIFSENGYDTTVWDPPLAGYKWIPDLSIYDEYPDIKAYNSMGMFDDNREELAEKIDDTRNRNFFCYSLFKIMPTALEKIFYNDGIYNNLGEFAGQISTGSSVAEGVKPKFMSAYNVLKNLSNVTEITENETGSFLMLTNDTAHEPMLLQEPQYEPSEVVDNTEYDMIHEDRFVVDGKKLIVENYRQRSHYQVNMAAFIKLGEWFDYLREQGVYDNTRIILVSDHGYSMDQENENIGNINESDTITQYNALLMVKDFNSKEFTVNNEFMTNADTPSIALEGIVDNPTNPFLGTPINMDKKKEGPVNIFFSHDYDVGYNFNQEFLPGPWYSVHDNIFDLNNWKYLGNK